MPKKKTKKPGPIVIETMVSFPRAGEFKVKIKLLPEWFGVTAVDADDVARAIFFEVDERLKVVPNKAQVARAVKRLNGRD